MFANVKYGKFKNMLNLYIIYFLLHENIFGARFWVYIEHTIHTCIVCREKNALYLSIGIFETFTLYLNDREKNTKAVFVVEKIVDFLLNILILQN